MTKNPYRERVGLSTVADHVAKEKVEGCAGVKPGYVSAHPYNHYTFCRTITHCGHPPPAGDASRYVAISEIWKSVGKYANKKEERCSIGSSSSWHWV